jgi:hypothetical protein
MMILATESSWVGAQHTAAQTAVAVLAGDAVLGAASLEATACSLFGLLAALLSHHLAGSWPAEGDGVVH